MSATCPGSDELPEPITEGTMNQLNVFQIFTSIQGESTFQGLPFTFIRMAGCNLRCHWCDSLETQSSGGLRMSVSEIVNYVDVLGLSHVCVTGGEPLVQPDIHHLFDELVNRDYIVTLETNGSLDISGVNEKVARIVDVKCPSSGMEHWNFWDNFRNLRDRDELKFVIADEGDYQFAKRIYYQYFQNFRGPIHFSPVWKSLLPSELAKWIICDKIPVRVHCQFHKILGVP